MKHREEQIGDCRLILGDCLEVMPTPPKVDSGDLLGYLFSDQLALFGDPAPVGFGCSEFMVRLIDRGVANNIIKLNHYSKNFYSASYIHLGLFLHGNLLGVLQFGYAMNPASQGSVVRGTAIDEYLELNRMWLDDSCPPNSESRALSYAIRFIRRAHQKIKWIQSFADERCRLLGVVYQACNFIYCGEHTATFWTLDNVVYHNSLMTRAPHLRKSAATLQAGKDRATSRALRQFRYIFFMRPRFMRGLLLPNLPYPKPNNAACLLDATVPTVVSQEHTLEAAPNA